MKIDFSEYLGNIYIVKSKNFLKIIILNSEILIEFSVHIYSIASTVYMHAYVHKYISKTTPIEWLVMLKTNLR